MKGVLIRRYTKRRTPTGQRRQNALSLSLSDHIIFLSFSLLFLSPPLLSLDSALQLVSLLSAMEDPPIAFHTPHNPKKRLFAGSSSGGSSSFVDPDVIEIPPPAIWKSKPLKQKPVVHHEVIVVDDEDSDDIMIIDEKVAPSSKGKKPMLNYLGVHNVSANNGISSSKTNGFVKGNISSHVSVIDDDFTGMDLNDTIYDDECAMLQAHFDSVDIPSGIEATVPWWPPSAGARKLAVPASSSSVFGTSSSSVFGTQFHSNTGVFEVDPFQSWSSAGPLHAEKSVLKAICPTVKHPPIGFHTNPGFHMQTSVPPMPQWPPSPAYSQNKRATSTKSHKLPLFPSLSGWHASLAKANPIPNHMPGTFFPTPHVSGYTSYVDPSLRLDDNIAAGISPPSTDGQGDTSESHILKKLELFQRFDSVEDHSDHHYSGEKESCNQPKSWKKKIFAEWDMLKNDLPDTIFVRIYEARMDLLRAVILGADGTPYHDGLFFFDVYFTPSYPAAPPRVNYHAHGLRINPNLYNCGKVCLSLLGTWSGRGNENWRPAKSNMLQVLVSIQGLILNAEPYYNEPGFSRSKNTSASKDYSENIYLLSLKTMLYTMKNPPKYFEDLVYGHFYKRAHDILSACRAYLDGVQVGSFIKGKSQAPQTSTGNSCSQKLKMSLPSYIKSLVEAFTKIGVKDCDKFLAPVNAGVNQSTGKSFRSSGYKSKY